MRSPSIIRAGLELAVEGFHARLESSSSQLIEALSTELSDYAAPSRSAQPALLVAIEAREPDLGLGFRDWPRQADPRARREQFIDIPGGRVVFKPDSGLQFLVGPDMTLVVGSCFAHRDQLLTPVFARFCESRLRLGYVGCRGAGVALNGNGITLCGVRGSGKTSLALRLLARGAALLADDAVLLHPSEGAPHMLGVGHKLRVHPGTLLAQPELNRFLPDERLAELRQLGASDLWGLEDTRTFSVDALFGPGRRTSSADLRAFVVLSWQLARPGELRVRRTTLRESPELIPLIARRPGPFHRGLGTFDTSPLLGQFGDVPVLELSGGVDFERASEQCWKLLLD